MTRRWRVRERASFAALRRDGVRRRVGPLAVTALLDGEARPGVPPRVAFAIGRSVGTAVVRNRIRRQLLGAISEIDLRPGTYLVGVGPGAAGLSYRDLRGHLQEAMA